MGFIDTLNHAALPVFYNVVHAVGKNCPNLHDDVMLVQHLLKKFYDQADGKDGWKKPPGEMKVTGTCGQTTLNWIIHFQRDVYKKHPGKIALDNRVDRVRGNAWGSMPHGIVYTLPWLNHLVAIHDPIAFIAVPMEVPMTNPSNVPPPSIDIVRQYRFAPMP